MNGLVEVESSVWNSPETWVRREKACFKADVSVFRGRFANENIEI